MILNPRTLYNLNDAPPDPRAPCLDRPTLLVSWWCTCMCIFIIFSRLLGRYIRMLTIYSEDWYMLATMFPLVLRMGLVHFVLLYGTNNLNVALMLAEGGGAEGEMWDARRRIGSKMVLAARVAYAGFIWSQKFCITEFYKRLTEHFWEKRYELGLKAIRWSLAATFLVTVISVFVECRPTKKLWQVIPDPGPQCRQAFIPLITMSALNVITDLLLVLFPIVAIVRCQLRAHIIIQLVFLFSLSLICVTISLLKVPHVIGRLGAQPYRSLWASFECLASCVVANAVVLNSFARDKGLKRLKFDQMTSNAEMLEVRRIVNIRRQKLGADFGVDSVEELMRRLGVRSEANTRSSALQEPEALETVDSRQWKEISGSGWPPSSQLHLRSEDTISISESAPTSVRDIPRPRRFLNLGRPSLDGLPPPPPCARYGENWVKEESDSQKQPQCSGTGDDRSTVATHGRNDPDVTAMVGRPQQLDWNCGIEHPVSEIWIGA